MKTVLGFGVIGCLCAGVLSGCVPVLVGGAAGYNVAYVAGELQATEDMPIQETFQATQDAVQDLGLVITDRDKDELSAVVIARGAEDKKVKVQLERVTDNSTMLKIRVGIIGDQNFSNAVLDRIESRLGTGVVNRGNRVS